MLKEKNFNCIIAISSVILLIKSNKSIKKKTKTIEYVKQYMLNLTL